MNYSAHARGNGPRAQFGTYRQPPETIRSSDIEAIYRTIRLDKTWGVRAMAMLEIMHRCALRKGEVRNLTADRITLHDAKPSLEVRRSKFDKGRNVPIDLRAMPALEAWASVRPRAELFFCTIQVIPANGISKGNPVGTMLSHGMLNRLIANRARAAGVTRPTHPHLWRHTCATNWLRAGLNLREIMQLLGHSSIVVTQRYLHAYDPEIEAAVYALARLDDVGMGLDSGKPGDRMPCPLCFELVQPQAVKCRWCQSMIRDVA